MSTEQSGTARKDFSESRVILGGLRADAKAARYHQMMALLRYGTEAVVWPIARHDRPSVVSDNPHLLLLLPPKAQLGRGEQMVDDQYIFVGAIVDEFGLAILAMTNSGGISPWAMPGENSI